MKKITLTILTICLMFLGLFMTSCNETKTFTIDVTNGTGGGVYEKGQSVTISATPEDTEDFDYWKVNDSKVSTSNPYTFKATADATYTAVFKTKQVTITVTNGTGSGSYDIGSSVTITPNDAPEYQEFDYWKMGRRVISTESSYTFTAAADVTYTAVYKNKTAKLVVKNGNGSGTYEMNSTVTVTARPGQYEEFNHWEINGSPVSTSNSYSFNLKNDTTIVAVMDYLDRGVLRNDATSISINPINVNLGGTITIDYKYVDSTTDADNGVSIFFGTDLTNSFGKYKIFKDHLLEAYEGVTFTTLQDGYHRLVIDVAKLDQVRQDCNAPTTISYILFKWFEATQGVYFDVTSEADEPPIRGALISNASSAIYLSKTYTVSEGGTIVLDYKYADPTYDNNNGVSIFFGTDDTNRFGNYKIFAYSMEKTYNGITFTTLKDGYNRITVDISQLDEVRTEYNAPTSITNISFRWFEVNKGVYFDVNPQDKKVKTTEFTMTGDKFVIANFTDIHVDKESLLGENGTVSKTIEYGINKSKPDILVFSGDIVGSSSDLNYLCNYLDGFKIPYFIILGNHDHEGSLGYDVIAQRINQSEYGYIEKGPSNLDSEGNYTIKIKNSEGALVHALIMMDTGNKYTVANDSKVEYVTNQVTGVKYGTYNGKKTYCDPGWNGLRGNQIDWYEDTVRALNCETTLICHIPFLEFCKAYEQYQDAVNKRDQKAIAACAPIGQCTMGEQICGSMEQLGLFDRILEMESTKNVICGHDHLNDFSLLYQGVRLTYALKTGEGAYWLNGGSRCGYTELTINNTGSTTLDQVYYNPLTN